MRSRTIPADLRQEFFGPLFAKSLGGTSAQVVGIVTWSAQRNRSAVTTVGREHNGV
jgi:hypothetical protein